MRCNPGWMLAIVLPATLLAAARSSATDEVLPSSLTVDRSVSDSDAPEPREPADETQHRLYRAVQRCLHWGGEDPYDEARARQIAEGWKRDCGEAVRLAEEALESYPDDGYVAACAVVLVGYLSGPPSIADPVRGDDATWTQRCETARRATEELRRIEPELYSDLKTYAGDACPPEGE